MTTVLSKIYYLSAGEDLKERFRLGLLLLIVFSLPFDIFYSSIIIWAFIAATLVDLSKDKIARIPKHFFYFQLIFLISLLGYAYSNHKDEAGFLIERQLAIFLFPIFIPLAIQIDQNKLKLALITLSFSCAIALIYLYLKMIGTILFELHLPFFKTIGLGIFFNHQFSRPLGIHAGYLSLYVSFSIIYMIWAFNKNSSKATKIIFLLLLILFFSGLFFLASRNTIIATFFVLLFVFPFFKIKNKLRYTIIMLICITISVILITQVSYLNARFSSELVTDISLSQINSEANSNIVEPRYERWRGGWELVKKSPLIGYGTGDEIAMLKTEYIKRGFFISYLENYNAHNQYLSYLIKNGILGLIIFLFAFYYYFSLAVKTKSFLYFSLLSLLLIGLYTENILDANKGILFFAFFNTFFGYSALNSLHKS